MRAPPKLNQAKLTTKFTYADGELYRKKPHGKQDRVNTSKVNIGYHTYPKDLIIYILANQTYNADIDTGTSLKVDHIDGNLDNNTITNLDLITEQEYNINCIKRKYYAGGRDGVHWDKNTNTYMAVKKGKLLGWFTYGDKAQEALER